jgi:hypothetical protein
VTTLSPPPQTRTIGTAVVGGKSVAVQADIAWFRYWAQGIYDRIGGATGSSNAELAALVAAAQADADAALAAVAALTEGHAIEDEGVALTQRATMNFAGSGVTVTDVGGKTLVTIPGGGGGGGSSYFPGGW